MAKENFHEGHRKRLDKKSRLFDLDFLEEHEQLEKILFAVIPRGDTNELAHRLITEFSSIYGVLTADVLRLKEVDGIGPRTAEFLHDLPTLLGIVERAIQNEKEKPVLNTVDKMGEYSKTLFYGKAIETLYMVSLNSSLRVIRYDKIAEGTSTATEINVHKIAKLAILNEAYAVVLTHNHPGGKCEPSVADLTLTRDAENALHALDVTLLDHIIVACGEYHSIKN